MKNITKYRKLVIALVILVALFVWANLFISANKSPLIIKDKIYSQDEKVNIGSNYFLDPSENPEGYIISILSAEIKPTEQLLNEYEKPESFMPLIDELGFKRPEYVYEVTVNIENQFNTDGIISFARYMLTNKSLIMSIDNKLTSLAHPELAGVGEIKIRQGISKNFKFIFLADEDSYLTNEDRVYEKMRNEEFYLCISEFPERILIKLKSII